MVKTFFIFIQIKMSLPQCKRDFIRKLVTGVSNVMDFDKLLHSIDKTDIFIKKHFLIQTDNGEYTVNKVRVRMAVASLDFDLLYKLLVHLDSLGLTLQKVFMEAQLNPLYFGQEDMLYARLIASDDLVKFSDLILYWINNLSQE